MIEEIEGDLLKFPNNINVIAHSCNTINVMGGGIAKQIKSLFPEAFDADSYACAKGEAILGKFSWCKLEGDPKKRIINLYTQKRVGSGRQVDYEGFYTSLSFLAEALESSNFRAQYVLGLPFGISCGLAGGSWEIIYAIINEVLEKKSFKSYIVNKD
jgi:O-acetyl-ADP-ribose deacetylase (regulator of RNase III)